LTTTGESLPVEITTYVGRRAEAASLRHLLEQGRVVTLTGPGGVGKTRLAAHVATALRESFADGVAFVPLGELHDPALVASAVAEVVGLTDRSSQPTADAVVATLRNRALLLVLDNCEHLIEACASLVNELTATCPRLVVLATSRQSLADGGEQIFPVQPLSVPEPNEGVAQLGAYDAVQLLVDRASAVVPGFTVTTSNAADVVRLCHQLDGLPLAIELAAVRLRALSVRQLSDRLETQLMLSAGRRTGPKRHETLSALIDWSYQLCNDRERLLWQRLSVFAGSVTIDAVEATCTGDGLDSELILDVIEGLIDKSILLRSEQDGVVLYRMLEAVRQYGEDMLRDQGRLEPQRRRHRDHYVSVAETFSAEWLGDRQIEWIQRLRREQNNIRVALDFCTGVPEEAATGMRLACSIMEYWVLRGFNAEARIQLRKLLEVAEPDAPERSRAMWNYAFLALVQGDKASADAALTETEALAARLHDEHAAAYATHIRAYAALIDDDMAGATELFGAANEAFTTLGDHSGELWSRYNLGLATALNGDYDRGREILRSSIVECEALGERFWRSWALWSLGAAEYLAGNLAEADAACNEVLRLQRRLPDRAIVAFCLTVKSGVATAREQWRETCRIFGAATAVWQSLGTSPLRYSAFEENTKNDIVLVTERLGEADTTAEFTAGFQMSLAEAIDYALSVDLTGTGTARAAEAVPEGMPLTARELEVARLVAQGMTNREIAGKLVIATRTVETHVAHTLTKLDLSNRVQLAAWIAEHAAERV
jgi:non-specific serine/threonine protein kinase